MLIEGKVALITGAARGLGKAYAHALLKRKAKTVIIVDILDIVGQQTVNEMKSEYGETSAIYLHGDVTSEQQMRDVFNAAVTRCDGLDVVINNAAVLDAEHEDIDRIMAVNQRGMIRGTELAINCMHVEKGGRGGVIINVSAMAALVSTDLTKWVDELLMAKDAEMMRAISDVGGRTEMSQVAESCMHLIEHDELPHDTVAMANAEGTSLLYPAGMPHKKLM